jgi:hypothetical protein
MQTDCLERHNYLSEYDVEEIKLNILFAQCPIAAHAAGFWQKYSMPQSATKSQCHSLE